jgi:hypothetical protein
MRNLMIAAAVLLSGLIANLTTTGGGDTAAQLPSPAAGARVTGGQPSARVDHPLRALCEYYNEPCRGLPEGAPNPPGSPQSPPPGPGGGEAEKRRPAGGLDLTNLIAHHAGKTRFLIATMPDPERTRLSLVFDRAVESMIDAAADDDWVYDRYWLPWRRQEEPGGEGDEKKASSDQRTTEEDGGRKNLPGLMLFRSKQDPERTLAMFLVGETPTDGVDRRQFSRAVRYMSWFLEAAPQGQREPVKIVGPNFSGSLDSLQRAIRDEIGGKGLGGPMVISPTATSLGALTRFAGPRGEGIRTTQYSDDHVITMARRYARFSGRLAYVTERGTLYGHVSTKEPVYYYPREISTLRNAYPEQSTRGAPTGAAELVLTPQQLLLRLRDPNAGQDTVPQFAPEQSAVSHEVLMRELADSLKKDGIDMVVVVGTNVMDKLFLSRFLQQAAPDIRQMILEPDVLFAHGSESPDYIGTLAATTYPLVPANLEWNRGTDGAPHRYYASADAEAVYNAVATLLMPSRSAGDLCEYAAPGVGGTRNPPVWLTVVGRNQYWPLAAFRGEDDEEFIWRAGETPPAVFRAQPPTRVWISIFLLLSVLVCIYCAICRRAMMGRAKDGKTVYASWYSDLTPRPEAESPPERRAYLCTATACAFLAYLTMLIPTLGLALSRAWGWWQILAVTGVVVAGWCLSITMAQANGANGRPRFRFLRVAAVLALVAGAVYAARLSGGEETTFFRWVRSVEVTSGVSPSLPLFALLLALGWWAWSQALRAIFAEERRQDPLLEPGEEKGGELGDVAEGFRKLAGELEGGLAFQDPVSWILSLATAAVVAAVGWMAFFSLEGRIYDLVFLILLAALAAALVHDLQAFARGWQRLRRLLEALELSPLRRAFSRLPAVASWSPLWQTATRRRIYTNTSRALECLELLHHKNADFYAGLDAGLTKLREATQTIQPRLDAGERVPKAELKNVSKTSNDIALHVLSKMEAKWGEGYTETLETGEKEEQKKAPSDEELADLLAGEFIARRFVAAIRYVTLQLSNFLSPVVWGFVLAVIALNCYPFQGAHLFRTMTTAMFVVAAVTVIKVFAEMGRDATLSRLSDTKAGRLDWAFAAKVVGAGVLPLLAMLGVYFPSLSRFILGWVQPALTALR